MNIFTKEKLIKKLKDISKKCWIENRRYGNQGGIGNTLEDLLGIEENNLPIPNAAEWELKTQKNGTSSLTTLFHFEPSPRAMKFVPAIFLPKYGWRHKNAGTKYPDDEMSFRQTIHGQSFSDRGFTVIVDRKTEKVLISFNSKKVADCHREWLDTVKRRINTRQLKPQPYWGFNDLKHKAGTKLLNTFYVQADVKRDKKNKIEYFHYNKIMMLEGFSFDGFLSCLENGNILIDFDARTGHNHGTKFRLRQNHFPDLYKKITTIL